MNPKVLIAGAGQLGSRYLQGLAKSTDALESYVFDISSDSLTRTEQRWSESNPAGTHFVHYISDLNLLAKTLDLVIVSSTADVRTELVKQIVNHSNVKHWLLEKVLCQSIGEIADLRELLAKANSVWVNTCMYLWPLYRNIRALYPQGSNIQASFSGFRGLSCNACHYIDFVSRWNGAPLTDVNVSGLHRGWHACKRLGFFDIDGKILMSFAEGSTLMLSSERNNLSYQVTLKIDGDEWQVFESEGFARAADGRVINGCIEYQSQLTAPLVKAILAGSKTGLPTFEESVQQHIPLLTALLEHWNRYMPNKVVHLPIT